jgi:pyridoxine 5-phosphate synthase
MRNVIKTKLNLEMAATKEMVSIALAHHPDTVTLVPEKREEVTTEGGLDVSGNRERISLVVSELQKARIPVSLFIEPDKDQIMAARKSGAMFIEIHTGRYANARTEEDIKRELNQIQKMAAFAMGEGLRVNAGHGLNYRNVVEIAAIPGMEDLNIGHSIIGHSVFVGITQAVKEMLVLINSASCDS